MIEPDPPATMCGIAGAARAEDRVEVRGDREVPLVFGALDEPARHLHRGVVVEHVERDRTRRSSRRPSRRQSPRARHVGVDRDGVAARRLDRARPSRPRPSSLMSIDRDARAVLGEQHRRGTALPGRGAVMSATLPSSSPVRGMAADATGAPPVRQRVRGECGSAYSPPMSDPATTGARAVRDRRRRRGAERADARSLGSGRDARRPALRVARACHRTLRPRPGRLPRSAHRRTAAPGPAGSARRSRPDLCGPGSWCIGSKRSCGPAMSRSRARSACDCGRSPTRPSPRPPGLDDFPGLDNGTRLDLDPQRVRGAGYWNANDIQMVGGRFLTAGPGCAWLRLQVPLVVGEAITPAQRVAAAADFASGVGNPLDVTEAAAINADLTIALHRPLLGEWVGLDSRVGTCARHRHGRSRDPRRRRPDRPLPPVPPRALSRWFSGKWAADRRLADGDGFALRSADRQFATKSSSIRIAMSVTWAISTFADCSTHPTWSGRSPSSPVGTPGDARQHGAVRRWTTKCRRCTGHWRFTHPGRQSDAWPRCHRVHVEVAEKRFRGTAGTCPRSSRGGQRLRENRRGVEPRIVALVRESRVERAPEKRPRGTVSRRIA